MTQGTKRALTWFFATILLVLVYPCLLLLIQDRQRFTIDAGDIVISLPGHYQATSFAPKELRILRKTPIYWLYPAYSWEVSLKLRPHSWSQPIPRLYCVQAGEDWRTLSFISKKGYGSVTVAGSSGTTRKIIRTVSTQFTNAGFKETTEAELKQTLLEAIAE